MSHSKPKLPPPKRSWLELSPSDIAGGCFFRLVIRLVVFLGAVVSVAPITLLAIYGWLPPMFAVGGSMAAAGFWIGVVGIVLQMVLSSRFNVDATGRKIDRLLGFGIMLLVFGLFVLGYAFSMSES
ncbi:MAG: hypothetical protein NXI22_10405 [bacterium]|nr:hypothetical protein [bacterium]